MAALKGRGQQAQIGSQKWVYDERSHANELVDQAIEEFTFAARDEVDWLNAHMAEIFSVDNFNVADVFKTPGKLKGKTPRTARKANPLEDRAPLTDVFSARKQPAPSPTRSKLESKFAPAFVLAEDKENHQIEPIEQKRFSLGIGKENAADSGYHDASDNETEVATTAQNTQDTQGTPTRTSPKKIATPLGFLQPTPQRIRTILQVESARRSRSHDSFVSAKEQNSDQNTPRPLEQEPKSVLQEPSMKNAPEKLVAPPKAILPEALANKPTSLYHVSADTTAGLHAAFDEIVEQEPTNYDLTGNGSDLDDKSSASELSSPERPVIRKKSSLNFASLPAREPLQMKKSVGARVSRTSQYDGWKARESRPPPTSAGRNLSGQQAPNLTADEEPTKGETEEMFSQKRDDDPAQPDSATKQLHSKTSTQRLHDRITMLAKSNAPQLVRAPPSFLAGTKRKSEETPKDGGEEDKQVDTQREPEDDWIQPVTEAIQPPSKKQKQSMPGTFDSIVPYREQTAETENVTRSQAQTQTSQPDEIETLPRRSSKRLTSTRPSQLLERNEENLDDITPKKPTTAYPQLQALVAESTTPAGSPISTKHFEGPLSASKAKLYSVFQTARGIFASSAGTSAQAKLEARPPPSRGAETRASPERTKGDEAQRAAGTPTRNLYPDIESAKAGLKDSKKVPTETQQDTIRAVRRSSERLRSKNQEEIFADAEQEPFEYDEEKPPVPSKDDSAIPREVLQPVSAVDEVQQNELRDLPPPPPPKSVSRTQQKATEARRPVKAQIKGAAQKSGPASVPILLASQKIGPNPQQVSQASSSQCSTLIGSQEPIAPPPPPKESNLLKKQSTTSLKSQSSSQSFKSSASSRPKALDAAARKKEEQEKEAQRKAEQKRDQERRRAEKLENEKKLAEQQRILAQKATAQKQAAERQRAEAVLAARKEQQARTQPQTGGNGVGRIRQVDDKTTNFNRSGYEASRPVSRDANGRPLVHLNPAKPPPKRQHPGDGDDDGFEYSRVNKSGPHTEKRQRTTQETSPEPHQQQRPTMAPPVRMSVIRKEQTSRFTPGYIAQAGTSYTSHSSFKASIPGQSNHHQQNPKTPHMHDMSKYGTARIPFANQPNPASQHSASGYGSSYHQQALHNSGRSAQQSKTPLTANSHRSSPTQYPNGDNISLPEIATDSEDSDAGDDFEPPDWANSPALRELLRGQQLVDPMKIFGPIGPLMMEEVFKGSDKNRLKKFRDRTSSANWNGPDRLTEEERRRDFEAREKLERDGVWTFDTSA